MAVFDFSQLVLSDLPQLRSTTSMQLGCDAHGYSRAGYDTVTWYCAVIAGRHSPQLSQMRGVSSFLSIFLFDIALICGSMNLKKLMSLSLDHLCV